MPLYGKHPFIEEGTYVAPNASVIGDVDVGEKSVVWYGAVLRGDVNSIKIGDFTSIGDRVVVHVAKNNPKGPLPTVVGNHVVVEQGAILHACTLEDESFVCICTTFYYLFLSLSHISLLIPFLLFHKFT
jgi:carbonic anhydrase/acetyltransferase-like protein (isoleucine patch superfamily)